MTSDNIRNVDLKLSFDNLNYFHSASTQYEFALIDILDRTVSFWKINLGHILLIWVKEIYSRSAWWKLFERVVQNSREILIEKVLIEIADRIILKAKFRSLFVQPKVYPEVYLACLANYSKISLFESRLFETHHASTTIRINRNFRQNSE